MTDLLPLQQAADLLHVSVGTLRRWDSQGRLKAIRVGPRRRRYYRREDLDRVRGERAHGDAAALLPALSAMLRVVSSTLDERVIGQTVVDEAIELFDADRSAIYFFDDAHATLLPFVAVDRLDPRSVEALFYPNPIPVSAQPLFADLLTSGAPIAVADTYDDPRTTRAFFELFDTRAVLCVPLRARDGQVFGMLGFFWVGRAHTSDTAELALADALGRQAAIAFENARFYQIAHARAEASERERRRQELLAEAGRLFSALLDPRELLDRVARLVCESMGSSTTIIVQDREGLRVAGSYQKDRDYRAVREALERESAFERHPLVQRVLSDGQPILSNNPTAEHATDPATQIASFIMVPLISHGRPIGTLGVSSHISDPRTYDADDLRMLGALADRAALALENAQLFGQIRQSRRQALEQAAELEAIFGNVPAGLAVYETGAEFACLRHNESFLQLVGQEWQIKKSIVGVPLRALFDEASYRETRRIFETVLASGERIAINEYAVVAPPETRPRYYKWIVTPLRDHAGAIGALLVSAIEVTEQVSARQRVMDLARLAEEQAAQLKLIVDSIADGVWVADASGAIIDINQRGAELLGMFQKQDHLRALPEYGALLDVRSPNGQPMPPEDYPLARALSGQSVVDDVIVRNGDTGQDTFLQISAAPVYDQRGQITGAVAVGRDITESVQLMRQKDEFLSVVSHELRTPVTAIKGYAQALERRLGQKLERYTPNELFGETELKKYADQLGVIVRQTTRLQRLVHDLLDLSSLQSDRVLINTERIDATRLVAEEVERMQVVAPTHAIRADLPAGPVWVNGDAARLEQVLTNLIENAIKYSPGADHIDVALDARPEAVTITVQDHGIGIPASEQPELFGRFFRASNASAQHYGGLGLGLYIASEIVKRHGGQMSVSSEEGAGSAFSFTLPPHS